MIDKRTGLFRKRTPVSTVEEYARLMGPCALCAQLPVDHLTWLIGSAISSRTPNRVAELGELISTHQWKKAADIREWEGREDQVEYLAVKCPDVGNIAIKKMHSVFELFLNDSCLADILVDNIGQEEIEALATGQWRIAGTSAG
jgi:hypothetical protein